MKKKLEKKKKLKQKLFNYILKNGEKKTSEKIVSKSFKSIQKYNKKSHNEVVKLSLINSTPTFRIVKLKNNRRKKKSVKEIPAFLSNYGFRTSWALKFIIQIINKKASDTFSEKFKKEILLNAKYQGNAVTFKDELQNQALKNKNYFRYYKW